MSFAPRAGAAAKKSLPAAPPKGRFFFLTLSTLTSHLPAPVWRTTSSRRPPAQQPATRSASASPTVSGGATLMLRPASASTRTRWRPARPTLLATRVRAAGTTERWSRVSEAGVCRRTCRYRRACRCRACLGSPSPCPPHPQPPAASCRFDASQPVRCQTVVGVIPVGTDDVCPFFGREDCTESCVWDAQGLSCRRRCVDGWRGMPGGVIILRLQTAHMRSSFPKHSECLDAVSPGECLALEGCIYDAFSSTCIASGSTVGPRVLSVVPVDNIVSTPPSSPLLPLPTLPHSHAPHLSLGREQVPCARYTQPALCLSQAPRCQVDNATQTCFASSDGVPCSAYTELGAAACPQDRCRYDAVGVICLELGENAPCSRHPTANVCPTGAPHVGRPARAGHTITSRRHCHSPPPTVTCVPRQVAVSSNWRQQRSPPTPCASSRRHVRPA